MRETAEVGHHLNPLHALTTNRDALLTADAQPRIEGQGNLCLISLDEEGPCGAGMDARLTGGASPFDADQTHRRRGMPEGTIASGAELLRQPEERPVRPPACSVSWAGRGRSLGWPEVYWAIGRRLHIAWEPFSSADHRCSHGLIRPHFTGSVCA